MKRNVIKFSIIAAIVALMALTTGVVVSGASKSKSELPKYLGSNACLGCHVDKYESWNGTLHAHMLSQVFKPSDLPGDANAAPAELKAELSKAAWIVAGKRFLARDPKDGALKYLNVEWNATKNTYVTYKGGANWETGCAGCHTTGWDKQEATFVDPGIGCEMCHGPGRDHVLGKGDVSKIITSNDAMTCGQCHTGGVTAEGDRWIEGFLPGDDMHAAGFKFPDLDPNGTGMFPDLTKAPKIRQYPLWEKSAHANSIVAIEPNGVPYKESCYKCHSAEGYEANKLGEKFDPNQHKPYNAVTCVACHDPHAKTNENQLKMPAEQLCISCHTASIPQEGLTPGKRVGHQPQKEVLEGYGAAAIAPTKGVHSDITCVTCHMTEGNHLMKIVKPAEVAGTGRKDSCTSCHTDRTGEGRDAYIEMWQTSITTRIDQANADVAIIDAVVKANANALNADLQLKFDTAKGNLALINGDGSKGAHNFEYSIKVMTSVNKQLAEIKKALGK